MSATASGSGPSFWFLVMRGMSEEVQQSIDKGFDVRKVVGYNDDQRSDVSVMTEMTALHIAAACGHPSVVAVLLKNGASLSTKDGRGCTPMHCAVRNEELECARLLLQAGSHTNTENNFHETPLDTAVFKGDVAMIRMLLEYKANACMPNSKGRFPKFYAPTVEIYEILQEEEDKAAKKTAFAMSHHKRLGGESVVCEVSPDVLREILKLV
jgi:ankyrin repeat protein